MANKRSEDKIKQAEIIENNLDIIIALIKIFKGQVLNIDLQEFCIAFNICDSSNQYDVLIRKLIKNKLVRIKKLRNTSNNVIIASSPITNYFDINAVKYSIETVIRNSYITHILKTRYSNAKNIEVLVEHLQQHTTFLSSKRRVETCYKDFMRLNEGGKEARLEAIYREEKRKINLKSNNKKLEDMELVYEHTMQTLRERDIFISKNDNRYKIYIMDNKNTYTLAKVAEKIADILNVEENSRENFIETGEVVIRKLAHFTIYTALGMATIAFLLTFNLKKNIQIISTIIWGFLYASTDELHQMFSSGRHASFLDVLLDTSGVIFGTIIVILIVYIYKKVNHNVYSNDK